MWHFLKSIFAESGESEAGLPESLLEAAIERAVDGTDRRLRALGNYRKRLREPVARTVGHVIQLVERLPEPAEISPAGYGGDPRLRAAFASPEHVGEVLGRLRAVRDFLGGHSGPPPDAIFGLLTMARRERQVLGIELDGETLKRDVAQTAVSFTDHRYLAPADSESAARWEIKLRAFDFLLERTLENMASEKVRRAELARERQLLRRKLEALKAGRWGLEPMFAETDEAVPGLGALEAEIEAIDTELGECSGMELGLEESLARIGETLGQPEAWLDLRPVRLNLDYRGIVNASAPEIEVCEVFSADGAARIVLPAWIPRRELPEAGNPVKLGQAYLGRV